MKSLSPKSLSTVFGANPILQDLTFLNVSVCSKDPLPPIFIKWVILFLIKFLFIFSKFIFDILGLRLIPNADPGVNLSFLIY